jgi:seryl-tRNA synthetase
MLDIKFIRENKDLIEMGAKKKHIDFDISKLIKIDDKRLEMLKVVEEKRAKQNEVSKILPQSTPEHREKLLGEMAVLKAELQIEEDKLKEIMKEWQSFMLQVPNIPDHSVPEGKGEEDNVTSKEWGEKPNFDFEPKDHVELMTTLDMVDFERGVKAHGFRGYYLKNDGALLSWAIWNYARDFFLQKGFSPFIAPVILNKEHFYGTGHLPSDAEDLFETQDGQYLSGTAEVPMMAYHSNEVLKEEELPKKYLAFSPCYRREAGSHSKDVKGLIRVHEFYKWEQLIICKGSHQESDMLFEEINKNVEDFIETLGLPYRRLTICTGDLSASKVKQYDTELWVPKENVYREIGSASYFHDFQTRRFGIRYKDAEGKTKYTHSMNATAIPTPRILVSLVENYQTADGKIKIPEVLRPYMGGREIIE